MLFRSPELAGGRISKIWHILHIGGAEPGFERLPHSALLIDARGFEVSGFDDGKRCGIHMRPQRGIYLIHG